MRHELTEQLRKSFDAAGIEYTRGYNEDDVTIVGGIGFSEDECGLLVDGLTVDQCIAAVMSERKAKVNAHGGRIIGHLTCGSCGATVERSHKFCHACGIGLEQ